MAIEHEPDCIARHGDVNACSCDGPKIDSVLAVLEAAGQVPWVARNRWGYDIARDALDDTKRAAIVRAVNAFAGAREALQGIENAAGFLVGAAFDACEHVVIHTGCRYCTQVHVLDVARAALAAMDGKP